MLEERSLSELLALATVGTNPPRFVDVLATLVTEIIAGTTTSDTVAAIGLTDFGEFHPSPWFEATGNTQSGFPRDTWTKSRNILFFGAEPPGDQVTREVRLPINRLKAIARAWPKVSDGTLRWAEQLTRRFWQSVSQ